MDRRELPSAAKPASPSFSANASSPHRGAVSSQLDIRQALIILRAHFVVALAIAMVACTLLGWQQMRRPRVYAASARLALEKRERLAELKRGDDWGGNMGEYSLATRVGELRSMELADYVIKSLTAEERKLVASARPQVNDRPVDNRRLAAFLRGAISVGREEGTLLVTLEVNMRDPEAAALVANRYAEQFIRYLFDKSSASTNDALVFLREQAEDLRKKLEAAERELQAYRGRYNLVSLDESQNIVVDRLKSLNASATAARVRRSEIEVRLKQAETAMEERRNPVELASLAGFGALSDVQKEIDALVGRRAVLSERYGRRHPVMQEITRTLESLDKLRDHQIQSAMVNLQSQRNKAVSEEKQLAGQLAEAEADALKLDQIGVEYGVLKRGLETQKAIYTQILSRLNEASISAQLESVNMRIADRAQPNYEPISPNLRKTAMILAVLAGAILLGYPFCVELLFARVRSGADVEYFLGSRLLGEIGSVRRIAESRRPRLVELEPEDVAAEQFRALFAQLQLVSKFDPPKSILITSTVPSEGKSFIACNLASAFVAHGKRVLLIDADLRRPSLHRNYALDNKAGLLRWLTEGGVVDGDIERDERLGIVEISPRHFLLRAGGSSRRASEIIGGGQIAALVTALQQRFDVVIFDTPPAGVFPDAISFAEYCHEIIFVCRFGVVSRQQIRSVLDRLRQTGMDLPGVVLNALPAGRGTSYYYHGYGSSKHYAKYYSAKEGS